MVPLFRKLQIIHEDLHTSFVKSVDSDIYKLDNCTVIRETSQHSSFTTYLRSSPLLVRI